MKSMRPWLAAGVAVTFCAAGVVWAASTTALPGAKASNTVAPAPKVSDEANKAIQGMLAAYANKKDYQGSFVLTQTIQLGKNNQSATLKGIVKLSRPNKLCVQLATDKDNLSVSCDGQQCMAYLSASQKYMVWKAPDNLDSVLTFGPLSGALQDMARVTLVPFSNDPYTSFMKGVSSAEMVPAEAGKGTHVRLEVSSGSMDIYLDPQTFLVTEARSVPTHMIEATKAQNPNMGDLKVSIDLKQQEMHAGEPVPAEAFATTPPRGAKPAATAEDLTTAGQTTALKDMVDFQLAGLTEGKTVRLSDYRGKVIALDFWATWCGPCRAELPVLQDIYKGLANKGLVLLAVNQREPRATVANFLKQQGMDFPVALDTDGKVGATYQVTGLPTVYLIGRDGKVADCHVGYSPAGMEKLRDEIAKLVDAPTPSAAPNTGH